MDFKRGKGVVAQARLVISNVYSFFCGERDDLERHGEIRTFSVLKKTCDATGVSKSTLKNIRNEAEAGQLKSPGTMPRNRTKRKTLDTLHRCLDRFKNRCLALNTDSSVV